MRKRRGGGGGIRGRQLTWIHLQQDSAWKHQRTTIWEFSVAWTASNLILHKLFIYLFLFFQYITTQRLFPEACMSAAASLSSWRRYTGPREEVKCCQVRSDGRAIQCAAQRHWLSGDGDDDDDNDGDAERSCWNYSRWMSCTVSTCLFEKIKFFFPSLIRVFVRLGEGWGHSMLLASNENLWCLYCQPTPRKWEKFASLFRTSER